MHTDNLKKNKCVNTSGENIQQTKPSINYDFTGKLAVELKTITIMTKIYCKQHGQEHACSACKNFVEYAAKKLDRCVYGQEKPACKHCPIHCYKTEQKNLAKKIMRYAGPKMLIMHPILAIKHLLKSKKKFPNKIPVKLSNYHHRKTTKR